MNIEELKIKLDELGVPQKFYRINESLASDVYVLNNIYDYWEYFYFDERGNKNEYRRFNNENDACTYFYKILESEMKYWFN